MKLIIAGGRNYELTATAFRVLDAIAEEAGITEVVSGRAAGVDSSGERWAHIRGLPVKCFPADWKALGKSAGPRRNAEMVEYADALAVFPGKRGTKDVLTKARAAGLVLFDFMNDGAMVEAFE